MKPATSEFVRDPNVAAVRSGDRAAFERLYRAHYHALIGYLTGIVSSSAVAEEIYQDLFLTIWRKRRSWQPRGSTKSYLYKAARNRAIDHLRHQKVEEKWAESQSRQDHTNKVATPDADLLYHELAAALNNAIAGLPERRRLIFRLSRDHQLTYREIAEVLEISIKTVETQMGRALAALREALETFTSEST